MLVTKLSPTWAQLDSVCASNPFANYHVKGSAGSTFLWNTQGDGTILSGQGTDSVAIQWNNTPGKYTISVKEINANGCEGVLQTLNVVVYKLSSTVNVQICEGESYTLPNGVVVSNSGSFVSTYASTNGCDAIVTTNLSYYPNPNALFQLPDSISSLNALVAPVDLSQNNITAWYWNFGDGSVYNVQDPAHGYNSAGQYLITLTVTNEFGCKDSFRQEISVTPAVLYIPNCFSPNGDGHNDIFLVYGSSIKDVNMEIFDRWGEKVFETDNFSNGWDGRWKGSPAPVGVYVYIAIVKFQTGTVQKYEGSITLFR